MDTFGYMHHTGLSPLIKWAGGKEKELPFIFPNLPQSFHDYYEPFVGGGSVFASIAADHYLINDISEELMAFYRYVAMGEKALYAWLNEIVTSWQAMLSFADSNRLLCEKYLEYREDKLTEEEMKCLLLTFLGENTKVLDGILAERFSWHREIYIKELEKNLTSKVKRMKVIEKQRHRMPLSDIFSNIETALMSALYMYFRYIYNDYPLRQSDKALSTALFVFIRNFAYSGMFRYNANGEFNVPYGGIGYNHKSLEKKIDYYQSKELLEHFKSTQTFNLDFETFLNNYPPCTRDFVFLDPPYDSTFSTYAKNAFSQEDHCRLAYYLLHKCRAQWMMIIKNTTFIQSLYNNKGLNIKSFDKKYAVSFMNRNEKKTEHLIITNYYK